MTKGTSLTKNNKFNDKNQNVVKTLVFTRMENAQARSSGECWPMGAHMLLLTEGKWDDLPGAKICISSLLEVYSHLVGMAQWLDIDL